MASEASGARWTASTNWIVAEGSLGGSISFESSAYESPTPTSGGLLLTRPPSSDPPPCEVTVCFRGMHEIHRVYVRSAARVYEIYYASDEQSSSKEYLCTVRCEASLNEVEVSREADGATNDCNLGSTDGFSAVPIKRAKDDSSNSDEDSWVKVKVPDPLHDDLANSLPKTFDKEIGTKLQRYYEATADISDASPCLTLTIRFLSLQTKTCVRIEEIYIYADPVESISSAPPISMERSLGGSSLLAMLVPSLLQSSKLGTRRNLYDDSWVPKYTYDEDKAADTKKLDKVKTQPQEACSTSSYRNSGPAFEGIKTTPEDAQPSYSHRLSDHDQMPKSVQEENNLAFTRVLKVLDDLVSRVERIEAFCSRFEEKMIGPINCIEGRLQQLEQKLDAFTGRTQSCNSSPSLRVSVPEFLSEESDSEDKDCCSSHILRDDSNSADETSPLTNVRSSVPVPQIFPSLIIRAPEFSSEDDENTNDDFSYSMDKDCLKHKSPSLDNCLKNTDDTIDQLPNDLPKSGKPSAIDDALTSALEALMSSTTIISPECLKSSQSLMEKSSEIAHLDENVPVSSSVGVTPLLVVEALSNCHAETNGCTSEEVERSADFNDFFLSTEDAKVPLFDNKIFQGLLPKDLEFRNEHDNSMNCHHNSDLEANYDLSASRLAAYLSSNTAQSVNGKQTQVDVSESFSMYDKKLASSSARVPHEESHKSGIEQHLNSVDFDNYLNSSLNFLFPKDIAAQTDHDEIEFRNSHVEAPADRRSPNCMFPDNRLEQLECSLKKVFTDEQTTSVPTKEGVSTDDFLDSKLNTNVSQKWHDGGWADDSDAEDTGHKISEVNLVSRGWIEDSSSDSNVDETIMLNELQIDWSDESSTDSIREFMAVKQCNRQAADIHTSSQSISGISVSHYGLGEASAGDNHGTTERDRKWLLDSMLDFCKLDKSRSGHEPDVSGFHDDESSILDVKFAQESSWKGRDPLEVLLGAVSVGEEQTTAVNSENVGDDGLFTIGRHGLSTSYDAEQRGLKIDPFFLDPEATMAFCNNDEALQGSCSSRRQI